MKLNRSSWRSIEFSWLSLWIVLSINEFKDFEDFASFEYFEDYREFRRIWTLRKLPRFSKIEAKDWKDVINSPEVA